MEAKMNTCEFLFETLAIHGGSQYGMEQVRQLDHALQCAALAEREEAPASLVIAALFHDLGHLIAGARKDPAGRTADDLHEARGAQLLGNWFGPDVTEPVRLHVPAKRYLCAVEPDYYDGLSRASKRSLALQGNPFDRDEAETFMRQPFAHEAVSIRRWDDRAKVPDLDVPSLDHYRGLVEELLAGHDADLAAAH
jgi:phosphonate degradation associated HDIG domain protein